MHDFAIASTLYRSSLLHTVASDDPSTTSFASFISSHSSHGILLTSGIRLPLDTRSRTRDATSFSFSSILYFHLFTVFLQQSWNIQLHLCVPPVTTIFVTSRVKCAIVAFSIGASPILTIGQPHQSDAPPCYHRSLALAPLQNSMRSCPTFQNAPNMLLLSLKPFPLMSAILQRTLLPLRLSNI